MGKINNYFSFSQGEKRGAVVLFLIIFLLIAFIQFTDHFGISQTTDFTQFELEINEFEKNRQSTPSTANKNELFDFNPNTLSKLGWQKLGFKDWQIKAIFNYKSKGGKWKTKNDVSKIYGLDSSKYNILKPYILLPDSFEEKKNLTIKEKPIKPSYFDFNPNTISKSDWKKLGFKDWQIKAIFNYKAKGGKWKTKNDVSKIYGLEKSDFLKLKKYILLPEKLANQKSINTKKDYAKKVNINTASAKEFTNLKGVNSEKYALIIIKYRESLGGFINKKQLKEVWNMTEETYLGFEQQLEIKNTSPTQLNINTAKLKDLTKHPYINWKVGNAIIKYRTANGKYTSVKDLKKIHLISHENYLKIAPYLTTK